MNVEAEGMPIKKLLGSGEYIIPNYQREYDWGLEEIKRLLLLSMVSNVLQQ